MANWNERLYLAALTGKRKELKLCIDKGADLEYKSDNGKTAFLSATKEGYEKIILILLKRGCNKDASDNNGKTALHLAAEYGHLKIVKYFVKILDMNPTIKTKQGETPYDLAAISEMNNLKGMEFFSGGPIDSVSEWPIGEVQAYLKTVMSQPPTEDILPDEIKLMADKKSIPLYLKLFESGSEKRRDIRLVIVGKKGSGKTSLLKRLFGEKIGGVTSTNGIEIHRRRCRANSNDGIWKQLDGNNDEQDLHTRLLKPYAEILKSQDKDSINASVRQAAQDKPSVVTEPQFSRPNATKPPDKTFTKTYHELQLKVLSEQFKEETKKAIKFKVELHDKEEYATLLLWDFAGDEEFYHTHQTFLSPESIYLVTAKLNEADNKQAKDIFRLWMDSIHCYSRLEEDKTSSDDNKATSDDIDPPVVVVGSKDAMTSESEKIEDECRQNIFRYTEHIADDERRHVRGAVFLSNTTDDDRVFQQLRQDILKLARETRTWNIDYPLKFIQLEKRLYREKKELPIIELQELEDMASKTPMPLNKEELILFLKFHHEIRALVFFEDLEHYIILDTQWLSNAFKCIVTAKTFRSANIKNQKRWKEFHYRGKLHSVVLEDILQNEQIILYRHKDHILKVMEKFDIIIRPLKSDRYPADEELCYYVPCMIKAEPEIGIYQMFNVTEATCKRSTWLCFKFRFLPPHLMNHLVASLCRKYEVAVVRVTAGQQAERVFALFKGTTVFELEKKTKLIKLLVTTIPNSIQIQILEFGNGVVIKSGMYKHIGDFVTNKINEIITTRFNMTNVKFTKKWECGLTKVDDITGSNEFSREQHTEYYCETCTKTHEFTNEWSVQPYKTSADSRMEQDINEFFNKKKSYYIDPPVVIVGTWKDTLTSSSKKSLDCYERRRGQRGLVLIVNFMFGEKRMRIGSDVDETNLTAFFRDELGYQVELRSDMTKMELQDCFHNIESKYLTDKSKDYHCFICVIMSHGNKDGLQTKDNKITVGEITEPFTNKFGSKFNGKPKLFLIEACRGRQLQEKVGESFIYTRITDNDESGSSVAQSRNLELEDNFYTDATEDSCYTDASESIPKLPKDADIIVAHATTPGYASILQPKSGSYFIRAFLSVAKEHYKEHHVEDILRKVKKKVSDDSEYEPKSQAFKGKC